MLKKALFYSIFTLFYTCTAIAQDAINPAQLIQSITQDSKKSFNADAFIESMLQLPYEKRQYVFPYIHEEPFLPEKIKTHPEIIIWKNKLPTRIAPQLADFAKTHLPYLSAYLYPYLDPDMWVQADAPINNNLVESGLYPLPAFKKSDYQYPTLAQAFQFNDNPPTSLTPKDIENTAKILPLLTEYGESLPDVLITQKNLLPAIIHNTPAFVADPFMHLYTNLKITNQLEPFSAFLAQKGITDPKKLMQNADIILKAYRTERSLTLLMALTFNKIRLLMPIESGKKLTSEQMYAKMYQVNPNDVYFVQNYMDKIDAIFTPTAIDDFSMWSVPIYID